MNPTVGSNWHVYPAQVQSALLRHEPVQVGAVAQNPPLQTKPGQQSASIEQTPLNPEHTPASGPVLLPASSATPGSTAASLGGQAPARQASPGEKHAEAAAEARNTRADRGLETMVTSSRLGRRGRPSGEPFFPGDRVPDPR